MEAWQPISTQQSSTYILPQDHDSRGESRIWTANLLVTICFDPLTLNIFYYKLTIHIFFCNSSNWTRVESKRTTLHLFLWGYWFNLTSCRCFLKFLSCFESKQKQEAVAAAWMLQFNHNYTTYVCLKKEKREKWGYKRLLKPCFVWLLCNKVISGHGQQLCSARATWGDSGKKCL